MPSRAGLAALGIAIVLANLSMASLQGFDETSIAESAAIPKVTGLRQIGALALPPPHGDIWFHEGYAYLGTWADPCPGNGVKIIDARDPAAPVHVASLATYPNTSAEDVVVQRVSTERFDGDLLAVGLQPCTADGKAGLDLWDVTDPASPVHLAYFFIPPGGVHELSMIQRAGGGRVLAFLAVPYAEISALQGDFRIVDVTDPYAPFLASEWGIIRQRGAPPEAAVGAFPSIYAHGATPSPDGMRVYVSYWDAGVQILDIRDPERPRFLGNTSYPAGAEGNAHSVDVDAERDLLYQADEDISHRTLRMRVEVPPEPAIEVPVVEAVFGPRVSEDVSVRGALVPLGRGCANDTYPRDPTGGIALVDRADCPFTEKVAKAQAAGALAVVVVNNAPGPAATMFGDGVTNITIPAVMVDQATGAWLRDSAANVTVTAELSGLLISYDPWGTLRIYDIDDPARPRQVGEIATPHATNTPVVAEGGSYTVHNPVVLPDEGLVVASWFSDGVRIFDVTDPSQPVEVASWVPPTPAGETPFARGIWGVFVDGDTIYASDLSDGLYVLEMERDDG